MTRSNPRPGRVLPASPSVSETHKLLAMARAAVVTVFGPLVRSAGFWTLAALLLFPAGPLSAQGQSAQFVYDPAGRLVQVIGADGTSAQYTYDAAGNLLSITPLTASTAAVTGFSSVSAPVGATVTIYGSGFSTTPGNNLVSINGVSATVVSSTANSLVVQVPAGATSGTVTVTDSNGTAQSTTSFVVGGSSGPPSISNFSPQIGAPGTAVTVSGTNFQSVGTAPTVAFANVAGTVTNSSASSLVATVPANASSGKISVSTTGGTAVSSLDFFVPPDGISPAAVASTARLTIGGPAQTLTIPGTGQFGLAIFDGTAGQVVDINVTAYTNCSFGYWINGPFGIVAQSNNCVLSTQVTLPATATYTLVAQAPGGSTITLQAVNASQPPVAITIDGPPVTVTTTANGQTAQLSFSVATPGQVLELTPSNPTFPNGCSSEALTVVGPGGARATTMMTGNLCSGEGLTLPVGTYTINVAPVSPSSNNGAGSVTLQLQTVPPVTGALAIDGGPVTYTTSQPGQQIQLSFSTTSANQGVTIQTTGDTFQSACYNQAYTITGPAPLTAELLRYDLCTAQAVVLPAVGAYTLTIIPYGTDTGSVSLQASTAPMLVAPITIDGPPVTVTTTVPAQQAQFTFATSTPNQGVSFQLSNCTFSDCYDAVLLISGPPPAKTYITTLSLSTAAQWVNLPNVGNYTLTVIPWDTDSGGVTLQLQNAPPVTSSVAIDGAPVTATTTVPGQPIQFVLVGTSANQHLIMRFSNVNFPSGAPQWILTGPTLASTTNDWVNNGYASNGPGTVTLPSPGTYLLTLTPNGTDSGTATLQLQTQPPPLTGTITIDGGPVTETSTVPAQNIVLSITGTSPSGRLTLQTNAFTFPSGCNASGIEIVGQYQGETSPCPGSPYGVWAYATSLQLDHLAPDTGTWTAQLSSVQDVTGSIQINGAAVSETTTVPLQYILLTFNSTTANQNITVQPSGSTFPSGCSPQSLQVIGSDGTSYLSADLCNSYATTLAQVGSYTLKVVPNGQDTGSVLLQITSP